MKRWEQLAKGRSEVVGTCWVWTGAKDRQGYARVRDGNRTDRLHHLLCKEVHQPPKGTKWVARHLCGCKACVNPAHIAPGTRKQNAEDDRQHALQAVQLPSLEDVATLADGLEGVELPPVDDSDVRRGLRRERLLIDQTSRGGEGVVDEWFRQMVEAVAAQRQHDQSGAYIGLVKGATDDEVLLLALMARMRRLLAGKREPERTGLATPVSGAEEVDNFRTAAQG